MDFAKQIKKIREDNKVTQEKMAQSLNVTRQAVSNWENNKNLPDIGVLISIATIYNVSLDQLILGDKQMNDVAKKLINDGSENKKARMNMISVVVGVTCFIFGILCLIARAITGDYIDANGILHEYFFLIPVAFVFFICGFITFLVTGIKNIIALLFNKNNSAKTNRIILIVVSVVVCLLCIGLFILLKIANS